MAPRTFAGARRAEDREFERPSAHHAFGLAQSLHEAMHLVDRQRSVMLDAATFDAFGSAASRLPRQRAGFSPSGRWSCCTA